MLAGWRAAPARFREDANAEDDLAYGGYRDRLVVELLQNAADAGSSIVELALDRGLLTARNDDCPGAAPLSTAGVAALATLRASAKREGTTVGRFGVGFAAVAAVADEVVVASTTGAVRFSRSRSARLVADLPELAGELALRDGQVPLLRLPFPDDTRPPAGWLTEVSVQVRPDAVDLVARLLAEVDPTLLLVLPGLVSLHCGQRRFSRESDGLDVLLDGVRYRTASAAGELPADLVAARPAEQRGAAWTVQWAVPVDAAGRPAGLPPGVPPVFRAPTPTDDPLGLPAVLVASLPLGPDRRRVVPGPVAEEVLGQAGAALAGLWRSLAEDPSRLALVPAPFAAGELDARLAASALAELRAAPVLPGDRRPADAVVLDQSSDGLHALLAGTVGGLLPAAWSARRWAAPLASLGVRRMSLGELAELLAGLDRPPGWWRRLYAELPPDREALGALPVPLSDGRVAPSARGVLVGAAGADWSSLGVAVVHPEAEHPLLLRLGAVPADPRAVLADPRVRAAVAAVWDDDDPAAAAPAVSAAVLELVAGAGLRAGELPWLAQLPLRDRDGHWRPAGELLLPDSPLARVVDLSAGFGEVAPGCAPAPVLEAVGVLAGFAVVPAEEADEVDGLDEWLATLPPGVEPGPVVRDLDLVRPDAWPEALRQLAAQRLGDLPYVTWWLARHPQLAGPPAVPGGRAGLRAHYARLAVAGGRPEPPARLLAVRSGAVVDTDAEDVLVVDRPDLLERLAGAAVLPCPLGLATDLADVLDVALASEELPDEAPPGGASRSWPAALLELGVELEPWIEPPAGQVVLHQRLLASGLSEEQVAVTWCSSGDVDHVVGPEGLARALAWRLGHWEWRHRLLARLAGTDRPDDDDLDPAPPG